MGPHGIATIGMFTASRPEAAPTFLSAHCRHIHNIR
jgi:hypothetical protein